MSGCQAWARDRPPCNAGFYISSRGFRCLCPNSCDLTARRLDQYKQDSQTLTCWAAALRAWGHLSSISRISGQGVSGVISSQEIKSTIFLHHIIPKMKVVSHRYECRLRLRFSIFKHEDKNIMPNFPGQLEDGPHGQDSASLLTGMFVQFTW